MIRRNTIRRPAVVGALNGRYIFVLSCALALGACKSGGGNGSSGAPSSSGSKGAGEFEGAIAMKIDSPEGKGVEMTYLIKGEHSRVETSVGMDPDAQVIMLWDLASGKITTLMPKQKMYMTMDVKQMGEELKGMSEKMKPSDDKQEFPKLTPTGKQETIAGYPCEHWLMGDKEETDMCIAKGLGYFGMGGRSGGAESLKDMVFTPKLAEEAAAHPEWVKLVEGGAFPLKVTVTEEGQTKVAMEATKIERKKLDAALFTIPPDYKEFKMPNLPRQN